MKALFEKIPLQAGEAFAVREFRVQRFTMPWHFHPECELTLIEKGRGMRYVGDSIARFNDGDLVFLGSNLPHYWWNDANDRRGAHSVVAQFNSTFERGALFDLPVANEVRRLFVAAQRGMAVKGKLRDEIAEDMFRLQSLDGWKRLCLLLEVLGKLAAQKSPHYLATASFSPELGERDGTRLTAVCKYVNESFGEKVDHERAATLAGLSPAAFSRFFHKRMGKTFEAYVAEIRIGHACRRLIEDEASVLEIAFSTGFNNLSNFNRHFLKLKGMTPSAYRRLTEYPSV